MIKYLQLIFDFKQKKNIGISFLVFVIAILTKNISQQIISIKFRNTDIFIFIVNSLVDIILLSLILIFYIAWIHFLTNIFDKYGDVKITVSLFGLSSCVFLLLLPFSLIYTVFFSNPNFFYYLTFLILCVFYIFIIFKNIKVNYSLNNMELCLILLSPLIILPSLIITFLIAVVFFTLNL